MARTRWIGSVVILFLTLTLGCATNSPTNPDPANASGTLVSSGGCNDTETSGAMGGTPLHLDCIYFDYDGSGTLNLLHANSAFNCCPEEIYAVVSVDDGTILIQEFETYGICECICLYDLEYLIVDLPPGIYELTVEGYALPSGEEPLVCQLQLFEEVSGEYCVERSAYPWG